MTIQSQDDIRWPEKFSPGNSPVVVSNHIEIDAAPGKVWDLLVRAPAWHACYFNASDVKMVNQSTAELLPGTTFTWKTFGAKLDTEVSEFVPYERLAWTAKGMGILAYHAWLIIPTANGCRVLTEETQHGWLCRLGKVIYPNRMYKYHQIWLEELKKEATGINHIIR